jgi:signal transduction histidine kinase
MGPDQAMDNRAPQADRDEVAALRAENAMLRAELEAARRGGRAGRQQDLLAAFSHDMRTSLNDITGFASILDDEIPGQLNARQRGFLGRIIGGSERLLRLVENLVAYGTLDAAEGPGPGMPVDYRALVGEAIEPLRPMADNKMTRIQVRVDVPGRPVLDRRGIALVVANLVSNALRLNGLGGMIDVEAEVQGEELVTRVRDYGPGLTPEELATVLDPPGDMWRQGATEFGLSLGRMLVLAHGGTMGVENAPGAGTTFWFRIPYRAAAAQADAA